MKSVIIVLLGVALLATPGNGAKSFATDWGCTSEGVRTHSIAVGECGAIWVDICQECRTQGTEWVLTSRLTCDAEVSQ